MVHNGALALALALDEVGEGDRLEQAQRGGLPFAPYLAQSAGRIDLTILTTIETANWRKRALEKQHDIGKRDLGRRTRQGVATLRPAETADDLSATKDRQYLIEVRLGNGLTTSDIATLYRTLPVALGEIDQSAHRVIGLHGKLHGFEQSPNELIVELMT